VNKLKLEQKAHLQNCKLKKKNVLEVKTSGKTFRFHLRKLCFVLSLLLPAAVEKKRKTKK